MAGNAGLNRVGEYGGVPLLSLSPSSTAVAAPTTAYGTIGTSDSGLILPEAIGFTKWTFSLAGLNAAAIAGYTVTIYGTIDPTAFQAWKPENNGPNGGPNGSTIINPGSWFVLPGPEEETGTGPMANPLTATAPMLFASGALVGIRAVLTAIASPGPAAVVYGFAVP